MMPPLFAVTGLNHGMHGEMNNSQEKGSTLPLLKMNAVLMIKTWRLVLLIDGFIVTTAPVNYREDATIPIFGIGLSTAVLFLSRSMQ